MAIRTLTQEDLRWLVCPVCREALQLESDGSTILCVACGRRYPIVDGLAVLLKERAIVAGDPVE